MRWWVLVASLVCVSCGSLRGGWFVPLPPEAKTYSSRAGADGVAGGEAAKDAEALLVAYLGERGHRAQPDGALGAAAAWILRGAYAGENRLDGRGIEVTAQRYGYTGLVLGSVLASLNDHGSVALIEQMVAQIPVNQRVARYGVRGAGRNVALVIGSVEVELAPFPRSVEPGGVVQLSGEVSDRYERASVFVRNPSGQVRELPQPGRRVEAMLRLHELGVHQVEVMGYGTTGPVVLMNVPVGVGQLADGDPSAAVVAAEPGLTVEQAESRLLALLNTARAEHQLRPVAADDELRSIALGHSQDMAKHHFIGHVSPTTGGPLDRMLRARIRLSDGGECVALNSTPERAHLGLLRSPAHRAVMLHADYTHVGIGVAFRESETGQRALIATLAFGRRPPPGDARKTATDVLEVIDQLRRSSQVDSVRSDQALTAAAARSLRALQGVDPEARRAALAAAQEELAKTAGASRRVPTCSAVVELLELRQLSQWPALRQPDLSSVGVAVLELTDERGPSLAVALVLEAKPGKELRCR